MRTLGSASNVVLANLEVRAPGIAAAEMYTLGGAKRSRTADLFNAIEALYQLSYGPTSQGFVRSANLVKGAFPVFRAVSGPRNKVAGRCIAAHWRLHKPVMKKFRLLRRFRFRRRSGR